MSVVRQVVDKMVSLSELGLAPTSLRCGVGVYQEILKEVGDTYGSESSDGPVYLLGLRVEVDPELEPGSLIVLPAPEFRISISKVQPA
jgi:hypothetical protein